MSKQMEWVEIFDTAIKIGLGATISGIFSLLGMKTGRRTESKKDLKKLKNEMLFSYIKN